MKFEDLQQEWKKEMAMAQTLENFSIDRLAAEAKHIERGSRFNGMIFGWLAVAILLLAAFLLLTNSVPRTPWNLVNLIGFPVLCAWISWLYFRAVRKPQTTDWTLAARISSEKDKLARQIALVQKVPTYVMLPIFIIILLGLALGLLDGASGESRLTLYIMLTLLAVTLVIAALVQKRAIRYKLQPMLDRLTQLEAQLQEK